MNADLFADGIAKLVLACLLILLNGFFVAAEIALVKIRHTQLEALARRGSRAAAAARRLKARINTVIGTTQVGITIVTLLIAQYVEPLVDTAIAPLLRRAGFTHLPWVHPVLLGAAFVAMSFVVIVAGELVPKALALQRTEAVALWIARPLQWFQWLAHPLIVLIEASAGWVLGLLGVDRDAEEVGQSVEEIRLVLAGQKLERGFELSQAIVLNSLDLRRRIVAEVMRPRREITFLNTSESFHDCLANVERSRYSRFPLCKRGDLDRTIGVVHIKDIYPLRETGRTGADLIPVSRPLIYVPESARLERLLQLFLERRSHFAIVVDEYGGTTGMVTLEDVIEQLVGPIQDEFDQEKPRITQLSETAWEMEGTLPLFELAEITGETVEAAGVATVGGWVTSVLGVFPKRGEVVPLGAFELVIEELDGMRVSRLTLRRKVEVAAED